MGQDPFERRDRRFNGVARIGLVGCVLGFATMSSALLLPNGASLGMWLAGVGVLTLLASFFILLFAVLSRDIPKWRQHGWRFRLSDLLSATFAISVVMASIAAADRDVSVVHVFLALGAIFIVTTIATTIVSNWLRRQYFQAMHAHGRYADWNEIAARLARGEGTALVASCNRISTVWWTPRAVTNSDEAQAAINADAVVTPCPKTVRVVRWLQQTFPAASIAVVTDARFRPDSPH